MQRRGLDFIGRGEAVEIGSGEIVLEMSSPHDVVRGCDIRQECARIVDVGLRPEHAAPFLGCWRSAAPQSTDLAPLSALDARWLQHYSLELAVIRPEQVIKRLFRAMSNETQRSKVNSDDYENDSDAFSNDASASDGGGDSFG